MTPDELGQQIRTVVIDAVAAGELLIDADRIPAAVAVERPKNPEHGDYAANIALQLAKAAGAKPRDVAGIIAARLQQVPGIEKIDIAGPGFLNITFDAATAGQIAADIVEAGESYGRTETLAGQRINVEFISANPTGPLHLGHARWAAVGDAIASVLAAAGADVDREFYINDRGVQMNLFGASIQARALDLPVPENGYQGTYVADVAAEVLKHDADILEIADPEEQRIAFREAGYRVQLAQQLATLNRFRTVFDTWSSERALHEAGGVDKAMEKLREQGHVYEADGAVWLRTTDFDDDKDRVLIKADGDLTYFASDCAYYVDKRLRGFGICIYLLGADHHGYVNRLRAVAACAGDDADVNIEILIGQLVKTVRDGVEVRLSKRAGEIVTLDDLVDEVGVDAARYTLIRYPASSPLTMDLGLLTKQTNDNPVHYVKYAHARISSVLRNAAELGIDWHHGDVAFDPALISTEREGLLLTSIGEFPRVVASAAELREPHRVARYLEDMASAYHRFYDECRVLPRGDEELEPTHIARLWLCAAARQTLANGLQMLGVSAPERM